MARIYSQGIQVNVNRLLMKKGPGYQIGLWTDKNNRLLYIPYEKDSHIVIEYDNANCKELSLSNCVYLFGETQKAIVGNSIKCEGKIINASAGNRCFNHLVEIKTMDDEYKQRYKSEMMMLETLYNSDLGIFNSISTKESQQKEKNELKKKYTRKKTIIKIDGFLDSLTIEEPLGMTVEVLVTGKVGVAKIGNCLYQKGIIVDAFAHNCITAHHIER